MTRPFACVVNLGCRVNRVESDRITSDLVGAGFSLVDQDEADIIVINTCAVTGEAESDVYKRQLCTCIFRFARQNACTAILTRAPWAVVSSTPRWTATAPPSHPRCV